MPWDRTIRELREENARLMQAICDGQQEVRKLHDEPNARLHSALFPSTAARLPESDNPTVGESVVDNVVDALNRRVVPPPDRTRLRDALDFFFKQKTAYEITR